MLKLEGQPRRTCDMRSPAGFRGMHHDLHAPLKQGRDRNDLLLARRCRERSHPATANLGTITQATGLLGPTSSSFVKFKWWHRKVRTFFRKARCSRVKRLMTSLKAAVHVGSNGLDCVPSARISAASSGSFTSVTSTSCVQSRMGATSAP